MSTSMSTLLVIKTHPFSTSVLALNVFNFPINNRATLTLLSILASLADEVPFTSNVVSLRR
ncbi:hypothetical protein [Alteromonas sp. 154]|uniref:hypothetical protein n=1 Tax=Alteromonas sp. 154 TaxID=2768847 RepID=UPI00135C2318|nr:hypothetical protein [Alteromonas sp. 154]